MQHSSHLELSKSYWKHLIEPGDIAIDATCGNGHDALFLSTLPLSHLFGMDIQQTAIENTSRKLMNCKNFTLFCMSHCKIDQLPLSALPRLIVYNLGYLPGGDKKLTTTTESTLLSVKKGLSLLATGGALSITCYPGHEEGEKEETEILKYVTTLSKQEFGVNHHRWEHRPRLPSLLWIQKLKSGLIDP